MKSLCDEIQASSDEIFCLWLQMKSNPASPIPALAGFHRVVISSTKWIYSDVGGFN